MLPLPSRIEFFYAGDGGGVTRCVSGPLLSPGTESLDAAGNRDAE